MSISIVSIVSLIEKVAGWPTQHAWVTWMRTFDWLSLAVPFIHAMLNFLEKE